MQIVTHAVASSASRASRAISTSRHQQALPAAVGLTSAHELSLPHSGQVRAGGLIAPEGSFSFTVPGQRVVVSAGWKVYVSQQGCR